MGNFSFAQTDVNIILSRAHNLIPGITKVMSVSYLENGDIPEIYFLHHPSPSTVPEKIAPDDKVLNAINNLRRQKNPVSWYSEDDIPFNIEKQNIKQLDVFKELEKNILMLSISGNDNRSNDLFFFYFNENISNFAITQSKKALNQENKLIIGTLLYHSISTILDIARADRKAFISYNSHVIKVKDLMKSAQESIESFREKHDSDKLNYVFEVINELSFSYGTTTFDLSKNAIKKIKEFEGDLISLRDAVKNAMFFAYGLGIGNQSQNVVLDDFHINFNEIRKPEQKPAIIETFSRQEKTLFLLDKLEEAATEVKKQRKPLTGVNVGKAFYKKISAPGITDALKNHKITINNLVKEHPERWLVIKKEFRPLINILSNA